MPDEGVHLEYYTATWCQPCKQMGPVIEQLKTAGWSITKIDVDQERDKAAANGVQAMPTFIIYKDGQPIRRIVGARQGFALETELRLVRDAE